MDRLANVATTAVTTRKKAVGLTREQREKFELDCKNYDNEVTEAKAELVKLTTIMPCPGIEQDPETRAAMFWDVLKTELSPQNITKVCRAAMRGNVNGDRYLPTPAQLISYANQWYQRRDPVRRDPRLFAPTEPLKLAAPEHRLLTDKDNPTVEDIKAQAERQFRIAAGMKDFSAELKTKYGEPRIIGQEDPLITSLRQKHFKNQPLLSDEALRLFREKPIQEAPE